MESKTKALNKNRLIHAYIVGLALGDGNLSNPNSRAVRLRITCDKKYPLLTKHIKESLEKLLPENRVSSVNRKTCVDVSCYSNQWPKILGWQVGSKYSQCASVPVWIKENKEYAIECLRGLLQTDGSIYTDRGYFMTNFVTYIPNLAQDVLYLMQYLGYKPNVQKRREGIKIKHTIRISKNTREFIKEVDLWKK